MGFSRPHMPGEPARLLLRASSNGRYLVHGHDTPFQIRGASPWCITQLSQADVLDVLDDLQDKGFNSFAMMSALSPTALAQYSFANFYEEDPFTDAAFTPNEAFWAHNDFIIEEAAERNQVVQLVPLYAGHASANDGWESYVSAASEAQCTAFGTWLGTRYTNYDNLIWVLGGDRIPSGAKWAALYAALVAADTRHLVSGHPARGESGRDFGSIVTLNSTYRVYTDVANGTLVDYQDTPTLPTFGFEFHYEGSFPGQPNLTAVELRAQAWQCMLSGGCGANYGHHTIWTLGVVDTVVVTADWKAALDATGAQDMAILHTFMQSITWHTLVPDASSTMVTLGRGTLASSTYVAAAQSADGRLGVAYIPGGGQIRIAMSTFASSVRARFFSPSTGAYTTVPGSPFSNSGSQDIDPPGSSDAVLLLEAQ